MKALNVVLIAVSLFTITACDDVKKQIKDVNIKNLSAKQAKAIDAAKDVEHQILEADQKRRKLVEELAVPGS